jgi:hypothetical protein
MTLTGNLCIWCGHDSSEHCYHNHSDRSSCCSGCMGRALVTENKTGRCVPAFIHGDRVDVRGHYAGSVRGFEVDSDGHLRVLVKPDGLDGLARQLVSDLTRITRQESTS